MKKIVRSIMMIMVMAIGLAMPVFAASGGVEATSLVPAHDLVLRPVLRPIGYSISYDLDGGTVAAANPTSYNIESGDITLNNPTKEGYEFTGWTGSNGYSPSKSVTIQSGKTGDLSFTANWEEASYTIVFNANGATGTMSSQIKRKGENLKLNKNTFTTYGTSLYLIYYFAGWNTKADGTGKAYDENAVFGNEEDEEYYTGNSDVVTLYAQWRKATLTIKGYNNEEVHLTKVRVYSKDDEYTEYTDFNKMEVYPDQKVVIYHNSSKSWSYNELEFYSDVSKYGELGKVESVYFIASPSIKGDNELKISFYETYDYIVSITNNTAAYNNKLYPSE